MIFTLLMTMTNIPIREYGERGMNPQHYSCDVYSLSNLKSFVVQPTRCNSHNRHISRYISQQNT